MYKPISVTLPPKWIKKIDFERQDVSRSRFVLRILEKQYGKDFDGDDE